jgi:hypothetical protein
MTIPSSGVDGLALQRPNGKPSIASMNERELMREYGVRRYGDIIYHHCMAESPADAAHWFAHAQEGIAGKDFQALVKDVALPLNDVTGPGANPQVVVVRHGPLTEGAKRAVDLKRTSPLR